MRSTKIELAFPCGANFSEMAQLDANRRLCAECNTVVHDLSAMSERDARAKLRATSDRLCVRYLHDSTGKVWFKEDLARASLVSSSRLRNGARGALAVASAMATFALIEACGGALPPDYREANVDGGDSGRTADAGSDAMEAGADGDR